MGLCANASSARVKKNERDHHRDVEQVLLFYLLLLLYTTVIISCTPIPTMHVEKRSV